MTHVGRLYNFIIIVIIFPVCDQILDENDNAPVFSPPMTPTSTSGENNASDEAADVVLWNRAASGHVVVRARASDADDGPNSDVEYSLIGGNDDNLFIIERKLGDVKLSRNLHGDLDDQVKPPIGTATSTQTCFCSVQKVPASFSLRTYTVSKKNSCSKFVKS